MSDVGLGAVVEHTGSGDSSLRGFRASVIEISRFIDDDPCGSCGRTDFGLGLDPDPDPFPGTLWCGYHWRKIGGSQSDTVKRFTEDLTPASRELETV